jgi:hypothetical protein
MILLIDYIRDEPFSDRYAVLLNRVDFYLRSCMTIRYATSIAQAAISLSNRLYKLRE